ncbi:MAG: YebC/PmpR family DNA-binding transcriptional regulator [Pseudobdellovibrionaceae bacterium]|nr:MAG: YebC/PmpR family DNA-binding transcriptional regulator [Pseudobdellovibrionaceae bacterium]
MGKSWKNPMKAAQAAKKGQLFTKFAKEIAVAAKLGGPDPDSNARLKLAVNVARAASCPKDTIERAIKKGSGQLDDGTIIEELTYEGHAPHNVGVIIECQTDNKNRTISDLRTIFNKKGGRMGESGSVQWMFDRVSIIEGSHDNISDPEEEAIEAGANDVEDNGDSTFAFYGEVSDLDTIRTALTERGWDITKAELGYRPKNFSEINEEQKQEVIDFLEALEDNDDTHRVYATIS